jgi:arylsulfatase A-like enzyme
MYFGFQKGFDHFFPLWDELDKNSTVNPKLVTDNALQFVEKCHRNFFLYCHYLQPHYPYVAPFSKFKFKVSDVKKYEQLWWEGKKFPKSLIQKLIEAYDDNLRWADKEIASLIKEGTKRRAIMVITSDHGEEFGEHGGLFHKRYRSVKEVTHVPLIIHGIGTDFVKKRFNLSKLMPMLMRIAS